MLVKSILLLLISIFCTSTVVAQNPFSLDLRTDKTSYDYGEPILVELTLTNTTDSVSAIRGSSTCIVMMELSGVEFDIYCTTDDARFPFQAGQSTTWSWLLDPSSLGVPVQDGLQTIRGYGAGMTDSIQIEAPKFYGGILNVRISDSTSNSFIDSLRTRFNAEVIEQNNTFRSETWKVTGHSIDSIAVAYQDDDRFRYLEPYRPLFYDSVKVETSLVPELDIPSGYFLDQNYPNPFNPVTTISYTLPENQHTLVEVFDIMGRKVSTLVDRVQQSGTYNIVFDASNISSGTYIYKITTDNFTFSRSMLLVK